MPRNDYELGDDPLRTLITEETKEIITKKFNQFLKNKYKTTSALKKSWKVVYDDEKIEDGTVKINGNWKYGIYDAAHKKDVYEFLAYLQEQHYNALSETIRSTGYKGLISGVTNMWNNITPYNSYSQSKYADFLPVNGVGANGFESKKLREDMWYIDYDAIITGNSHSGNEFLDFAENRVSGVPYIISSWGTGFVSPTSYEAPVLMSVLASQQNWTPIQYCFAYDEISDDMFKDLYSTYSNPVQQALSHIAVTLYYNTDELQKETIYNYNKDYLYVDKEYNGGTQPNIHRKPLHPDFKTLFTNKSNVTFYTTPSDLISKNVEKYETVNDNMYFDMIDGRFLAHNDKAIVYAGKNSRIEKYGRLEMDIFSQSGFVGLISADDKNIDESERMLLSVGGRVLNKDMEMNEIRIIKYGTAPMLYENIIGDKVTDSLNLLDGNRVFLVDTVTWVRNEDNQKVMKIKGLLNGVSVTLYTSGDKIIDAGNSEVGKKSYITDITEGDVLLINRDTKGYIYEGIMICDYNPDTKKVTLNTVTIPGISNKMFRSYIDDTTGVLNDEIGMVEGKYSLGKVLGSKVSTYIAYPYRITKSPYNNTILGASFIVDPSRIEGEYPSTKINQVSLNAMPTNIMYYDTEARGTEKRTGKATALNMVSYFDDPYNMSKVFLFANSLQIRCAIIYR